MKLVMMVKLLEILVKIILLDIYQMLIIDILLLIYKIVLTLENVHIFIKLLIMF